MIDQVTSKNRNAAKRLLNAWYASTEVRNWPLAQLQNKLQGAVNDGLTTEASINRALREESKDATPDTDYKTRSAERSDNGGSEESKTEDGNGSESEKDNGAPVGYELEYEAGRSDAAEGFACDDQYSDDAREQAAYEQGYADGESSAADSNASDASNDGDSDGSESDSNSNEDSDGDSSNDEDSDSDESESDESESESNDESEDDASNESESESESEDETSNNEDDDETSNEDNESEDEDDDEDDAEEIRHEAFEDVLGFIAAGCNVALVGPAGSGKSYIARKVAEVLGKEFRVNGAAMSKYDLIGFVDAHGTYHETPAYEAFVNGYVHCFDEADASAPEAMVAFNGMTDDQPYYTFPCGQRDKHAEYVAVACMNTWGNGATADYVGRFKQDAASMSRFVQVYVGYDKRVEAHIAGENNLDICHRVWSLRETCEELGIKKVISTRMIIQACKARAKKMKRSTIDRCVFFAGFDDAAVKQIKAAMKPKLIAYAKGE